MEEWMRNPKNGEALTREQFDEVMKEVVKNHRFAKGGRYIKYVTPIFDMRDMQCFNIKFRLISTTEFDSRQSDESMYERIMKWLKDGV